MPTRRSSPSKSPWTNTNSPSLKTAHVDYSTLMISSKCPSLADFSENRRSSSTSNFISSTSVFRKLKKPYAIHYMPAPSTFGTIRHFQNVCLESFLIARAVWPGPVSTLMRMPSHTWKTSTKFWKLPKELSKWRLLKPRRIGRLGKIESLCQLDWKLNTNYRSFDFRTQLL